MSKRQASEALDEGPESPASKKSRFDDYNKSATPTSLGELESENDEQKQKLRENGTGASTEDVSDREEPDEFEEEAEEKAPIRQSAPTAGYDDLYLDTIDRNVLDFDFEKLCSVTLSNINVYACLVCGKYYQGRGPNTHAYFHALDEDHHVFINLSTQKVYVLPEGYEVKSKSLDDIKYVSDPRYTRQEVAEFDRKPRTSYTLQGKEYTPGFVGMNNIKENDYLNVIVQALSHVSPLRNFFLLEDFSNAPELVKRTSILFRKIWNPRAFKAHVSPHELLQEVSLCSNKRFTLTAQSDPVDFLSWYLNNLHLGLGGSKTKPQSSVVQRIFQGKLKVESQAITARADHLDRLRFEEATEIKVDIARFLLLTLDLPPAPLFQDEQERNIIPQVPLTTLLAKYNGVTAQELNAQRKRYRLMHPLPPFLLLHIKRFTKNRFIAERNPTIVVFDPRSGLDISPYVEPDPSQHPPDEPIIYDLVANVVHEAVRAKEDVADSAVGEQRKAWKVQLRDKATGEWVVAQDLFVEKAQAELLYLGESYLQVWERRKTPQKGKGKVLGKS
ncbi:ubiquitin thiolesterase-like protein [Thermochaetoides thermophila DSM 1495]|uniref:Ubiquitin thiolesterase-like protein n=1 Tax=Chaetomium thermophilum (strain DSM 1495 / CBS 144.50 / IMI 039719) TaxID=759272 RepID=G0SG97_CHATD|nr:ubiquitin thiolesterase-like protein [Thermochaetoides thermophila DSM 1495]EGS17236.1 ubiquitin thiolesterase-like protein [Thermochaetoides thermophila DSM 1495]